MRTNQGKARECFTGVFRNALCTGFVRLLDFVQRGDAFVNHQDSKYFHGEPQPPWEMIDSL